MLLEPERPPAKGKRFGIITRSHALEALLHGLLAQWRYTVLERPDGADVLLVEEGCQPPAGASSVLWLTRSGDGDSDRLGLPLQLEELWRHMGKHSRNSHRNHIRIPVQLPATLRARGEYLAIRVNSLSDLGTRFDFPRELANGERLTLHIVLEGEGLTLAGQVIYVVPRGEMEGTGRAEVGMIFDQAPPGKRDRVRDYVIWRYLAQVRRQVPEPLFRQGLGFFRIPQAVLERLAEPG